MRNVLKSNAMRLADYQVESTLKVRTLRRIHRARDTRNGREVLLREINLRGIPPLEAAAWRSRWKRFGAHGRAGRPVLLEFHDLGDSCVFAFEPRSGTGLREFLENENASHGFKTGGLNTRMLLETARSLTTMCAELHEEGVALGNARPDALLILRDGRIVPDEPPLLEILYHDKRNLYRPELLKEFLPYLAPEQGETGQPGEFAADLYSLGVMLYEMAMGYPPFVSDDPLELLHMHLAAAPAPAMRSDLPGLGAIIMKLLAKAPRERYRGARGVLADLDSPLLEEGGLAPGESDFPSRFELPEHDYGRESESRLLAGEMARLDRGGMRGIVLEGESGLGKSDLLRRLPGYAGSSELCFALASFRREGGPPAEPVITAVREVCRSFLAESEERLARPRKQLKHEGIIPPGSVLPELNILLEGDAPFAAESPAAEKERLRFVITKVLRALSREKPLVLRFDDVQWMDPDSRNLLELIARENRDDAILLVLARRSDSVDRTFEGELPISAPLVVRPGPLNAEHTARMVADGLGCSARDFLEPAEDIVRAAGGNPWRIRELLAQLHREGLIRRESTGWTWDADEIRSRVSAGDYREYIRLRFSGLSPGARAMMVFADCSGGIVEEEIAAAVLGPEYEAALEELRAVGLFSRVGGLWRYGHDRIRDIRTRDPDEEEAMHPRIARALLKQSEAGHLFEIVRHLKLGMDLLSRAEHAAAAGLNLRAAREARARGAYEFAADAARTAGEHLRRLADGENRELEVRILTEEAWCEYLAGRNEDAEAVCARVEDIAANPEETASIYELRINLESKRNRNGEAIRLGLEWLGAAGILKNRSMAPSRTRLLLEYARIRGLLLLRPPRTSAGRIMQERRAGAAMRILLNLCAPAYQSHPELLTIFVFRMVRLTISRGTAPESAFAWVMFGMLLAAGLGEIKRGLKYARLGLALSEKNPDASRARVLLIFAVFMQHWHGPVRDAVPMLEEGRRAAVAAGDPLYAGYCAESLGWMRTYAGRPIDEVLREGEKDIEFIRLTGDETNLQSHLAGMQGLRCLLGLTRDGLSLDDDHFSEAEYAERHTRAGNLMLVCGMRIFQLMLYYQGGRLHDALRAENQAAPLMEANEGLLTMFDFIAYGTLVRLALLGEDREEGDGRGDGPEPGPTGPESRREMARKARRGLKQLARWARIQPGNFGAVHALARGEFARVKNRVREAHGFYEEAMRIAAAKGQVGWNGLACELAARARFRAGEISMGRALLSEALRAYDRGGYHARTRELRARHENVLKEIESPPVGAPLESERDESVEQALARLSPRDVIAIFKAGRALAAEGSGREIVGRFLESMLENSGAQRGVFLRPENGSLKIDAERSIFAEDSRAAVPEGIARYTFRTGILSCSDIESDSPGFSTPGDAPRSYLCMAVRGRTGILGCLYLENQSAAGIFTPARLEVLRLLCATAGAAVEGALLREEREKEFRESVRLTREVEKRKLLHREADLRSARLELELLRKSIQPHFLMNSLTAVTGLIEEDAEMAAELVNALAEELRILLDIQDTNLISLARELKLCRAHLKVMSLRRDRRYSLETRGLREELRIPPLIFLTLIENGITHGVGEGEIRFALRGEASNGRFRFDLFSPGGANPESGRERAGGAREGTGLKYVRGRLREAFGDDWQLDYGPSPEGWRVRVEIGGGTP